jgi:hypothetical protein
MKQIARSSDLKHVARPAQRVLQTDDGQTANLNGWLSAHLNIQYECRTILNTVSVLLHSYGT